MLDSLRVVGAGDQNVVRFLPAISTAIARWDSAFVDPIPSDGIRIREEDPLRSHLRERDRLFDDVRVRFADLRAAETAAMRTRATALQRADIGSLILFLLECVILAVVVFQLMRQLRIEVVHATDAHHTIEGQNAALIEQRDVLQSQTMQLQEQAAELEVQQADLQAQTVELETTLEELRSVEERERELAGQAGQLNQRLIEAQQVAQIGYWEIDSKSGDVFWSDEMYRLCGLEPVEGDNPPTDFYLSCVHPDDRTRMTEVARQALEDHKEFTEQYRLRGSGGKMQTVLAKGRVVTDPQGNRKLIGTVQNITDRVQLEDQLRQSQKMEAVGRSPAASRTTSTTCSR